MSQRIDNLKLLIERQEKCGAKHIESVLVRERFENRIIWEGVVEVFQLEGHPTAKRAYAWALPNSDREQENYKVVLGLPPVNSAQNAVKVAVVDELKKLIRIAENERAQGRK